MKFNCITSDPPWIFSDKLLMSDVKRGAESQYCVMNDSDIINLDVKSISADDCILALWVPGSKLSVGMECCRNWGFEVTQSWIWVKTKQNPLGVLEKNLIKSISELKEYDFSENNVKHLISEKIKDFDMDDVLNFFMGHCFRPTHELVLIGTRGKYTKMIKDKSQRSVHISPAIKMHSKKPEELQDRLDKILPDVNKLEMFARRDREGWTCVGLQCPSSLNENIKDSINRLLLL
jgi:N6-adenosine-specific RNA methylase IME4